MELKARTKLACKIANIDPARFNEAVHFNKFACAPSTTPGSARIFYEHDIIALRIYASLVDRGLTAERAGNLACDALAMIRYKPEVKIVTYVETNIGLSHMLEGPIAADAEVSSSYQIEWTMEFRIQTIRNYVRQQLEFEMNILGED